MLYLVCEVQLKRWQIVVFFALFLAVFLHAKKTSNNELELSQTTLANALREVSVIPPSVGVSFGPLIPGLQEDMVPQGLAWSANYNRIFISHYLDKKQACVSVLDAATGGLITTVRLENSDGTQHAGHVGGISVLNDYLYVSSDGRVYTYKLSDFISSKSVLFAQPIESDQSETKASFCAATETHLLVGEFAYHKEKRYRTARHHHLRDRVGVQKYAWICGYFPESLDQPEFILSVRQKVQGICVTNDRVFLSVSYGRRNHSLIVMYSNPIGEAPHQLVEMKNDNQLPLWYLDEKNYISQIELPPMAQGIVMLSDGLAVVFESGAKKFQKYGKAPIDRVLMLKVPSL